MREAMLFPFVAIVVAGFAADIHAAAFEKPLVDKTLVVWASPANLHQRGGTALTIDANGIDRFIGRIKDARLYDKPLDRATVAAMQPGKPISGLTPWAWWDFSTTGTYERTGRFNEVKLSGDATIEDGCLVLGENNATMIATSSAADASQVASIPKEWSANDPVPASVVQSTRLLRERLLADPYRPGYHFCVPEDMGRPGDPNGCFYAGGRYHLMYLYNRNGVGFCWGHVSSKDLVHWRHHPDSIGPGNGDEGCFSGGGFVDDDGTAYLSYWMLWGDKGIGIAKSSDRHFALCPADIARWVGVVV